MATPRKRQRLTAADRDRYLWLLDQVTSAPIDSEGARIFDLKLALPPARTIEESIDLARRPFVLGRAITACFTPIIKQRSKVTTVACEPVELARHPGFRYGLHREPGHRFHWQVTEFSTGAVVTKKCPTREAALVKLKDRVGSQRAEYFREMVANFREQAYERAKRQEKI